MPTPNNQLIYISDSNEKMLTDSPVNSSPNQPGSEFDHVRRIRKYLRLSKDKIHFGESQDFYQHAYKIVSSESARNYWQAHFELSDDIATDAAVSARLESTLNVAHSGDDATSTYQFFRKRSDEFLEYIQEYSSEYYQSYTAIVCGETGVGKSAFSKILFTSCRKRFWSKKIIPCRIEFSKKKNDDLGNFILKCMIRDLSIYLIENNSIFDVMSKIDDVYQETFPNDDEYIDSFKRLMSNILHSYKKNIRDTLEKNIKALRSSLSDQQKTQEPDLRLIARLHSEISEMTDMMNRDVAPEGLGFMRKFCTDIFAMINLEDVGHLECALAQVINVYDLQFFMSFDGYDKIEPYEMGHVELNDDLSQVIAFVNGGYALENQNHDDVQMINLLPGLNRAKLHFLLFLRDTTCAYAAEMLTAEPLDEQIVKKYWIVPPKYEDIAVRCLDRLLVSFPIDLRERNKSKSSFIALLRKFKCQSFNFCGGEVSYLFGGNIRKCQRHYHVLLIIIFNLFIDDLLKPEEKKKKKKKKKEKIKINEVDELELFSAFCDYLDTLGLRWHNIVDSFIQNNGLETRNLISCEALYLDTPNQRAPLITAIRRSRGILDAGCIDNAFNYFLSTTTLEGKNKAIVEQRKFNNYPLSYLLINIRIMQSIRSHSRLTLKRIRGFLRNLGYNKLELGEVDVIMRFLVRSQFVSIFDPTTNHANTDEFQYYLTVTGRHMVDFLVKEPRYIGQNIRNTLLPSYYWNNLFRNESSSLSSRKEALFGLMNVSSFINVVHSIECWEQEMWKNRGKAISSFNRQYGLSKDMRKRITARKKTLVKEITDRKNRRNKHLVTLYDNDLQKV